MMSCVISLWKKCPRAIVGLVGFLALLVAVVLSCFFIKNSWTEGSHDFSIESALKCVYSVKNLCAAPQIYRKWDGVIPSEDTVAEVGHFAFSKPLLYSLNMTFSSKTRFNGSEKILLQVNNDTNEIVLNVSPDLGVNWKGVILQPICRQQIVCLQKVFVLSADEVVVLHFSEPLVQGWYMLHIDGIQGQIVQNNPEGDRGLFLRETTSSWVIGTLFQMRYARRVFPSYDHPSLKAHFQLCIQHAFEDHVHVASNMPVVDGSSGNNTCFQMTPILPIYVMSLALYHGMDKVSIAPPNLAKISTLTPSDMGWVNPSISSWMLPEAHKILESMQNLTGTLYPLPELIFVNTPSAPFWGIENAGLVTLDLDMTKVPMYEEAHTILVHEIIHQWLGNLFTIDKWENICLQEGLTAYMETVLAGELLDKFSVGSKLSSVARAAMRSDLGNGPVIRNFNKTNDIADVCFNKPPVIFHMIDMAFNQGSPKLLKTISNFLIHLSSNYSYLSAGLDAWAMGLNNVTGDEKAGDVLKSYMQNPGFPVLMVTLDDSRENAQNNSLRMVQRMFRSNVVVDYGGYFTLPPLEYLGSNSMSMYLPSTNPNPDMTLDLPYSGNITWFLLDAQSISYSKILYSAANYLNLLNCFHPRRTSDGRCDIPSSVNKFRIFDDLCWAMNFDLLPIEGDRSSVDVWNALLHRLAELADDSSGQPSLRLKGKELNCDCCFKMLLKDKPPKFDSRFSSYFSCDSDIKLCKKLTIMKLIM